jgi:hypothetical protein
MGDVSKLNVDGEWLELDTELEDFGKMKVKVIPANSNRLIHIAKEDIVGIIVSVVVEWDLSKGRKKVPCDEENKYKYLSALSEVKISNPRYALKGEIFRTVGSEILAFSQNIKNFTKN